MKQTFGIVVCALLGVNAIGRHHHHTFHPRYGIPRSVSMQGRHRAIMASIHGLQHLTGVEFAPDLRPRDQRIVESVDLILDALL